MRRVFDQLKTLAVAIGALALVGGAAFGLQDVLLPTPGPARLTAADVSGDLRGYRASFAVERIGGRRFHVSCRDRFIRDERLRPGDLILIRNGPRLTVTYGDVDVLAGRDPRLALEQLLLSGCPRELAGKLAHNLFTHAFTLGPDPQDLRFRAPAQSMELLLSRRGDIPLRLRAAVDGLTGWSIVHFARA